MKKILVVGYGNSLRHDDGVGIYVADLISREHLPGVVVETAHQLDPVLIEKCAAYDCVILIDCAFGGPDVLIHDLSEEECRTASSTHHLDAVLLKKIAERLNPWHPDFYLVSVRGENFEFGEAISEAVRVRAREAFGHVMELIEEEKYA